MTDDTRLIKKSVRKGAFFVSLEPYSIIEKKMSFALQMIYLRRRILEHK